MLSKNFETIQAKLRERGLPQGVSAVLFGKPGTGKTESVMQIAKETNRSIIRVDISDTKSCWFGESEKMIKKIFKEYDRICKKARESKNTNIPIILFLNEADAILGKRKDTSFSSTAQTENTIQNIILEELEKHTGIIIATTNLIEHFDAAFERRFLFKITFDNPSVKAKESIWKSKINWLSDSNIHILASNYDFSGGEIDNVVRKTTIREIITNIRPQFNEIQEMCKIEKIAKEQSRSIGFAL